MPKGTCSNYSNCSRADERDLVFIPSGAYFVCPECGNALTARRSAFPWGIRLLLLSVAGVVAAAIFGVNLSSSGTEPPSKTVTAAEPPAKNPEIESTPQQAPSPPQASSQEIAQSIGVIPGAPPGPATPEPTETARTDAGKESQGEAKPNIILRIHGDLSPGRHLVTDVAEAFLRRKGATQISRSAQGEEITVTGDTTDDGTSEAIHIIARDTKLAFTCLRDAHCDIGLAGAPIQDEEYQFLSYAGLGDMRSPAAEHVLAFDAVAILVHAANPVTKLSRQQLKQILTGGITDWRQVGGSPRAITLHARDDSAGTTRILRSLVLGPEALAPTATIADTDKEVAEQVASDPNGIGYVPHPDAGSSKVLAIYDEGGGEPRLPNLFAIGSEDYLLSRRVFLYSPQQPRNSFTARFIEFALSAEGQSVVEKTNLYISQRVEIQPDSPGPRTRRRDDPYEQHTQGARRLSVTFRFRTGVATLDQALDNKAWRDVPRVVEFLKGAQTPYEIRLIGFSDNQGGEMANFRLSLARAQLVERLLDEQGVKAKVVTGLGELYPVASNDSKEGRDKNRRVEVWLK